MGTAGADGSTPDRGHCFNPAQVDGRPGGQPDWPDGLTASDGVRGCLCLAIPSTRPQSARERDRTLSALPDVHPDPHGGNGQRSSPREVGD